MYGGYNPAAYGGMPVGMGMNHMGMNMQPMGMGMNPYGANPYAMQGVPPAPPTVPPPQHPPPPQQPPRAQGYNRPQTQNYETLTLLLEHIGPEISELQVTNSFRPYMPKRCVIQRDKRLAYVEFSDLDMARRAKTEMEGSWIGQTQLSPTFSRLPPPTAKPAARAAPAPPVVKPGSLAIVPSTSSTGGGQPTPTLPPDDVEKRKIIDKLAEYVVKNGPDFERITIQKQASNPKFAFLRGPAFPGHAYYRWKTHCLRNNLTEEQAQLAFKLHKASAEAVRVGLTGAAAGAGPATSSTSSAGSAAPSPAEALASHVKAMQAAAVAAAEKSMAATNKTPSAAAGKPTPTTTSTPTPTVTPPLTTTALGPSSPKALALGPSSPKAAVPPTTPTSATSPSPAKPDEESEKEKDNKGAVDLYTYSVNQMSKGDVDKWAAFLDGLAENPADKDTAKIAKIWAWMHATSARHQCAVLGKKVQHTYSATQRMNILYFVSDILCIGAKKSKTDSNISAVYTAIVNNLVNLLTCILRGQPKSALDKMSKILQLWSMKKVATPEILDEVTSLTKFYTPEAAPPPAPTKEELEKQEREKAEQERLEREKQEKEREEKERKEKEEREKAEAEEKAKKAAEEAAKPGGALVLHGAPGTRGNPWENAAKESAKMNGALNDFYSMVKKEEEKVAPAPIKLPPKKKQRRK